MFIWNSDSRRKLLVGAIISLITAFCVWMGWDMNKVWEIYNQIERHFGSNLPYKDIREYLNRELIKDPKYLESRIKVELDSAIGDYEKYIGPSGVTPPLYIEKAPDGSKAQELLGGEMRLCGIWVADCKLPETIPSDIIESPVINIDKPPADSVNLAKW
jgi:hypothetical protein